MGDPPSYPDLDSGDDTGAGPDRRSTTGTSSWQKVVGIIGLVVVLWVGSEMYTAIYGSDAGAGGPGPGGGDTPIENQDQDIDTEDDGDHDPSQFDHG